MSVVVPPWAAAIVPVSKSSAEVVPPKGMSRWVWTSMPPGITSLPEASITVSAGMVSPWPMSVIDALVDVEVGLVAVGGGDDGAVPDEGRAHAQSLSRLAFQALSVRSVPRSQRRSLGSA